MKETNQGIYFKDLDGLRGIAALAVVLFHSNYWFSHSATPLNTILSQLFSFNGLGGELGVQFFFILSGFLITYLMFEEQSKTGNIKIGNFYMRRVLRIWPLYYLSVIVGFLLFPLLAGHHALPANQTSNMYMYLMFATNFDHILSGSPSNGMLGVQWSVAVEEQYYLLWPLVFFAFGKKRYFFLIPALGFILSEWFFASSESGNIRYFHFFSNFRYLAFGALMAWAAYFYGKKIEAMFSKCKSFVYVLIYTTGLSLLFFFKPLSLISLLVSYGLHFVPFLFFGFVILEQIFSKNSFFKLSTVPLMTWLGKISYGLYLTHMIAIYTLLAIFPANENYYLLKTLLSLFLTIFISHFSYIYFESYFLNLKSKFNASKNQT